jgi:hypothetical protein
MYNNLYQSQIETLQAQIDRMKSIGPTINQPLNQSSNMSFNDEQIKNLVRQEISAMFPQVNQTEQEIKPVQLTPHEQMIKEINDLATAVLAPEDLTFLNSPDMIKCVPVFLKSTRGKEAVALLMNEYKSYIEGK